MNPLSLAIAAINDWPTKDTVDEVALLFPNPDALELFCEEARAEGWEHFNRVDRDMMVRLDRPPEAFDVRFEFFRLPGAHWRIEAMTVLSGTAPLHVQQLLPSVIHVSYKCPSLEVYHKEVRVLMERGDKKVAEYRNSYGMFSYWRSHVEEEIGRRLPYLKPRVNLRD